MSNDINGLPGINFAGTNTITQSIGCNLSTNPTGTFTLYVVITAKTAQVNGANGGVDNRIFSGPTTTKPIGIRASIWKPAPAAPSARPSTR